MRTVFEEDIQGLKEFVERARKRELEAIDVLKVSIFSSGFIVGTILIILKVKIFIALSLLLIYFIVSSVIFGLLFMKKDLEEHARLAAILIGGSLWILTGELYEWYTGWELDPTRVPWLQAWESPGFYIGAFIGLITGIIVYRSIKKFYGGGKK
ncbi:MAG: hypothetical protein GXO66_09825 [Euryarchaeota archaeon]|nr:hypothetical protein [Euryarchaeota archaeon]